MNPELQRNLWLEMTTGRLIGMPLVLGLLFSIPAGIGVGTVTLATVLFLVLTLLWGTRQAADAVPSEVAENTWDWQRLSVLSAWQLTWGKLFGATLFTWYGGLICLFVLWSQGGSLTGIVMLVGASLIGQGVAFLTGLQAVRLRGHRSASGTMMAQLIGIFAGSMALQFGTASKLASLWNYVTSVGASRAVNWYGAEFDAQAFAIVSLYLFLAWTLLACCRLMMREMQYRTRPWAWPAFVLFSCIYGAGLVSADLGPRFAQYLFTGRLLAAFAISAILTYVAMFWEDKNPVVFRRLLRAFAARDWRSVLANTQSWMVSLALSAAIVVVLLVIGDGEPLEGVTIWGFLIASLFFMLRDISINLYFWLSPRQRRANLVTVLVLGLLYWIIPVSAGLFGQGSAALFFPWAPASPSTVILAGALEAGVVIFFLAGRWRRRFQLQPA